MSLDPPLSDNELLRIANEREAKRRGSPIDCGPDARPELTEVEARVLAPPSRRNPVTAVNLTKNIFRGALIELSGTVHGAPRTKKGHTTLGIKQSAAYTAYRNGIIDGMMGKAAFPPVPLWLNAQFYRDNESADLVNLLQGFCDALENAAVVPDDNWIMAFDGSRVHLDRLHPRVEFTIAHLK